MVIKNKFKVWCKNRQEWEKDNCFLNSNGILMYETQRGGLLPFHPDTHELVYYTFKKIKRGRKMKMDAYEKIDNIIKERLNEGDWEPGDTEAIVLNDGVIVIEVNEEKISVEIIAGEPVKKDITLELTEPVEEE